MQGWQKVPRGILKDESFIFRIHQNIVWGSLGFLVYLPLFFICLFALHFNVLNLTSSFRYKWKLSPRNLQHSASKEVITLSVCRKTSTQLIPGQLLFSLSFRCSVRKILSNISEIKFSSKNPIFTLFLWDSEEHCLVIIQSCISFHVWNSISNCYPTALRLFFS